MTTTPPNSLLQITPEEIFKMHPRIRMVELASEFGQPIFQKMRDGLQSISPDELDDEFLRIGPHVITGFCRKYEPWYGSLSGLVVYHDKITILIAQLSDNFLVVSFDPDTPAQAIKEIASEIHSKWDT
jgi:hypothetical protein